MGISGISPWSLLLILAIALLLFGTSRVRSLGSDLANVVKDFRKALHEDDKETSETGHDTEDK
jgi:sec-independent protein translocase protein TatA